MVCQTCTRTGHKTHAHCTLQELENLLEEKATALRNVIQPCCEVSGEWTGVCSYERRGQSVLMGAGGVMHILLMRAKEVQNRGCPGIAGLSGPIMQM